MTHAAVHVHLCEVWPRDGIQGWEHRLPTANKLAVIEAVTHAGIREVDVTSLVSPRASAQFWDAAELLAELALRRLDISVRVLAVNRRSMDRLEAMGGSVSVIDTVGSPIAASEAHNLANLHKTHAQQKEELAAIIDRSRVLGLTPLVCVATAFGCPLSGIVTTDQVLDLVGWAHERGVRKIMLGDTTGMSDPRQSRELFSALIASFPDVIPHAHFHDTRGSGIANTIAAIDAGVRRADVSLGGLGGEPPSVEQHHSGETGNVCTEDLVALLDRMGITTGIDTAALLNAGRLVEDVCGQQLRSQVLRAGLAVPREGDHDSQ